MADHPDRPPLEDPQSHLERALIEEFLRARGYQWSRLHELPEDEGQALMKEACGYAAAKLTEVESRAHYVHEIHGVGNDLHKRC